MVTSVFQGFYDVTIATKITGYVGRVIPWIFNYGSLWPSTSGTRFYSNAFESGIQGGWCDVFSLNPANPNGPGRTSLNQWGDVTGAGASGNVTPGYWDNEIIGMSWVQNGGGGNGTIRSYRYGIDLGQNSNYLTMPMNALFTGNINGISGFVGGGSVFMPTANWRGIGLPPLSFPPPRNSIATHYGAGGTTFEINNDGAITSWGTVTAKFGGIIPNTALCSYGIGGPTINKLALDNSASAPTQIDVTWDDTNIDTAMKASGTTGGIRSTTVTRFGWLFFYLGTVAIAGRTLTNFMVLTSFDGTQYWLINMLPGDAAAITALGAAGGAGRTGHITPGTFWFQSPQVADKVFAGAFPADNFNVIPVYPLVPLPVVPPLNLPIY